MGGIWTDEAKYRAWLEVEATASEVLAEDGIVPSSAPLMPAFASAVELGSNTGMPRLTAAA